MSIIMWERGTYVLEWKNHDKIYFGRQTSVYLGNHKKCNLITQNEQLKDFIRLYVRNRKHFEIKDVEMQAYKNCPHTEDNSQM